MPNHSIPRCPCVRVALVAVLAGAALLVAGCELFGAKSRVSFAITDAPVSAGAIEAVTVTVGSVSVNQSAAAAEGDSGWITLALSPAKQVDLLALQNGLSAALGDMPLTPGTTVNQIRLGVDQVLVRSGGVDQAARMPSVTGLKIVKSFDVPLTGPLDVVIDFDARKSLVANASGFILKPALRAVVANEAGRITGGAPAGSVVYAYADPAWNAASEPLANADGIRFANARTSAATAADGSYVLAYLEAGSYTAVAADAAGAVLKVVTGLAVAAGGTTRASLVP